MTSMSKDELSTFLKQGTFTAKLATVNEDGSPHVVPLWFILDSESNIIFGTETRSIKGKNILRDPRVSICVDDQEYPYSFVTIFGQAEIFKSYIENPYAEGKNNRKYESSEFLHWMKEISARYVGLEKADRYARRNSVEGAVLYRVRPQKIVSEKVIADW
jgi:PPOX class probable F420-dependent enzyme